MSVFVHFKCDGTLPSGMSCRGGLAIPGTDADLLWAKAQEQGWTDNVDGPDDDGQELREFCPSCSGARARGEKR